jgi:hypothetical protein
VCVCVCMDAAGQLRRRQQEWRRGGLGCDTNIATAHPVCKNDVAPRLGALPALLFSLVYSLFVITGVVLTSMPPSLRTEVAGQNIPADAKCYRANRNADYVTVEYALGGPMRRVQVLLRLDKVVGDLDNSVRLFGDRVIESRSMQCDSGNASCFDTVLLTDGNPNRPLRSFGIQFGYTNPTVEREKGQVASAYLRLSGEMYAARGYRYYLTNTHLCVSRDASATVGDTSNALSAHTNDDGYVLTSAENIASMPTSLLGHAAVSQAHLRSECAAALKEVYIWPHEAASEIMYLAITDPTIYEAEPDAVVHRRQIVELGYPCASSLNRYEHSFNLYNFDCNNAYAACALTPTLPFRRVATYSLRAHYTLTNDVYYWLEKDVSLQMLPGIGNQGDAVRFAIVKLSVLILAAAVMWVRSDRATSASHWLYSHCIRHANCVKTSNHHTPNRSVIEDALLGLMACCSRAGVVLWRWDSLTSVDQSRVCITELAAAMFSLISWVFRFWVISPNLPEFVRGAVDERGPLTRLGGSMAIVDASCAVILAFAEAPMHISSSRFDDTARLLGGLVVAIVTLNRCLFAIACNAIILESHHKGRMVSNHKYTALLMTSIVMWTGQTVSISVVLSDLVASPMAFQLSRSITGDASLIGVVLFLALVCVSLPRLMHTVVKLVSSSKSFMQ